MRSIISSILVVFLISACGSHEGVLYGYRKGAEEKKGEAFSEGANLAVAIDEGDSSKIADFLTNGGSVDYRFMETGNTLLIQSTEKKKQRLIKMLLDRGADRSAVNLNGENAEFYTQNEPALERLFQPLAQEEEEAEKLKLLDAARIGKFSTVKKILRKGANPNFLSADGDSPLILAVRSASLNTVKIFFSEDLADYLFRTEVNFLNSSGESPLAVAQALGDTEIRDFLFELGAR